MTQSESLNILKTGANVFLTGEPGSGKTYTINLYLNYLRERGVAVAVTASTGIAATHLNGMTIHSWSGLGVRQELTDYDLDKLTQDERLVKRLRQARVLVIDEVSMLAAKTLDLVDRLCKELRGSLEPFGGLQVIVVGDFFQLPPVTRGGERAQFAYEARVWPAAQFIICYLSEQHRQEDSNFLAVLAALRAGKWTESHRAALAGRVVAESGSSHIGLTKLFPHNADVDRLNHEELAKLSATPRHFAMKTSGAPGLVEGLKRNCLSPETLSLKVGAKVMFTKNSVERKFVNGTTGEVTGFQPMDHYPLVKTRQGKIIVAEPLEWTVQAGERVLARVTQVPLRLAWAITVHKSQGMSLDAALIDLKQAFEYGQGYVALSRVRSLAGLHLLGFNERALEVHPEVKARDGDFRGQSSEARATFGNLAPERLKTMQDNFIVASGGSLTPLRSPKLKANSAGQGPGETLRLVKEQKQIREIAKERKLTTGTIIKHLEDLRMAKKLKASDLAHLALGQEDLIAEIRRAFRRVGKDKLKTAFDHLKGEYPYDLIRLARLLDF